jgi:hypothetical protein
MIPCFEESLNVECLRKVRPRNDLNGAQRWNDWNVWNGPVPEVNGAKRLNDLNVLNKFSAVMIG